ncbi:GNAT family N-acetyltransferase [Wenzhouxiangella sp. XN79A]|uniref:GNAT family N-acetyltransferase n=1 Tax=Wenzhouxiangella sp. XN79A TaxID=2724193 RepID=UPI00144AE058|nr:GNAT family N-acetyltransferase [Wenzhouxiangella sp. XN79A]NKI36247.1 GNAT family N-acetyltransferase [Wenzhouxiangella sp. XN79A]
MKIRYRQIVPSDIPSLFAVRIATWHNEHGAAELAELGITPESVGEQLLYSHRGWVAEGEGRVIGFAIGNHLTGEMWVIAVLKEYEGHGIGMRLLASVENWLFSEGWNEIWLTTDPDENYRAVGFYRHLGWKDWKLEPDGDRFMKKTEPNRFEHVQDGTESQ